MYTYFIKYYPQCDEKEEDSFLIKRKNKIIIKN